MFSTSSVNVPLQQNQCVLFNKSLDVVCHDKNNDGRKVKLDVTIEALTETVPVYQKVLIVQLTDDKDPFFLYTLHLREQDFQELKTQQGLLVDFTSFPQKFIALLEMCLREESNSEPKYLLTLSSSSTSVDSAMLCVIETNSFKHLTHLSLTLSPGNDRTVKEYLAGCLIKLKDHSSSVETRLAQVERDLSARLTSAKETLNEKSRELDTLRAEWSTKMSALSAQHAQLAEDERERTDKTISALRASAEKEKRELEMRYMKDRRSLEEKVERIQNLNREFEEKRDSLDRLVRDLKTKNISVVEESTAMKDEISVLKRTNAALTGKCNEQQDQIHQLESRLSTLDREMCNNAEIVARNKDMAEATHQSKLRLEAELHQKKERLVRLEGELNEVNEDVRKANDIIKKLQMELKSARSKVDMRTQIASKQEAVIKEKDAEISAKADTILELQESMKKKEEEYKKTALELAEAKRNLECSNERLSTNENVIAWLNKQLNELRLKSRLDSVGTALNKENVLASTGIDPKYLERSAVSAASGADSGMSYGTASRTASSYGAGASTAASSSRSAGPGYNFSNLSSASSGLPRSHRNLGPQPRPPPPRSSAPSTART